MRIPTLCWRIAVAALAIVAAAHARAEVHFKEQATKRYDIWAREGTPEEVWKGVERYGPYFAKMGVHAIGLTELKQFEWKTRHLRSPLGCRIEHFDLDMAVTVSLPEWWQPKDVTPEQVDFWKCVLDTVTVHEHRHVAIWRETGQQIDAAVRQMTDWFPCETLGRSVNATVNRVLNAGSRRQAAFDAGEYKKPRYQKCQQAFERASAAAAGPKAQPPHTAAAATDWGGQDTASAAPAVQAPVAVAAASDGAPSLLNPLMWLALLGGGMMGAGYYAALLLALRLRTGEGEETEGAAKPDTEYAAAPGTIAKAPSKPRAPRSAAAPAFGQRR